MNSKHVPKLALRSKPRKPVKTDDDEFLSHFRNPALFSYTEEPIQLLRQIQDYMKQREERPLLGMVLFGSTLTDRELEGVLHAEQPVEAARALIAGKIDRFS